MKWSERTVRFWWGDVQTSVAVSLIGFVVAFVSSARIPQPFGGLLLYLGMLLTLWGARSAVIAFNKEPNTLPLKKVVILLTLFTLFGVLLVFI